MAVLAGTGARSRAARRASPRRRRAGHRRSAPLPRGGRPSRRSPAPGTPAPPVPGPPGARGRGHERAPPGSRSPGGLPVSPGSLRRYRSFPRRLHPPGGVHVRRPHVSPGRRLDDVLREPAPPVFVPLEFDRDPHLAEGVLPARHGVYAEVREAALYVCRRVHGAEDGVDGSLALGLGLEDAVLDVAYRDGGPTLATGGGDHPEGVEHVLALERAHLVGGYGLEVGRRHGLFVVRYLLEADKGALEDLALHKVAELLEGVLEGVTARVLAQKDVGALEADVLFRHDLEGAPVLEHPVLVDARLVQESVPANDRLVRRHLVAGHVRDQAARVGELLCIDTDLDAVEVPARGERHHHLLEGGVPGPLAEAVHGDLDLARPDLDAGQGVGDRHPEVVVAVDGEHPLGELRDPVFKLFEEPGELDGRRVADGVGDVDDVGPRLDRRRDDLGEVAYVGPGCVHRGELDVGAEVLGELDGLARALEDVLAVRAHLVLDVEVGGTYKGVDAGPLGPLDGLPRPSDVLFVDAGEARDAGALHLGGDAGYGLEVALRGDREARLYDVHLQAGELAGYLHLLRPGE